MTVPAQTLLTLSVTVYSKADDVGVEVSRTEDIQIDAILDAPHFGRIVAQWLKETGLFEPDPVATLMTPQEVEEFRRR